MIGVEVLRKSFEVKNWGKISYHDLHLNMEDFRLSAQKKPQLWFAEVPTIITMGLATNLEDLKEAPFEKQQTNRGGKATLHTEGQILIYPLAPITRIRDWVFFLEQWVIDFLSDQDISSFRLPGKPGVYTHSGKIASLGLRISQGWSYHGLSLNVHPDLQLFEKIVSCGDKEIPITSLHALGMNQSLESTIDRMISKFFELEPPVRINDGVFNNV